MRQHYTPETRPSRAMGVALALAVVIGLGLAATLVHGLTT